MSALTFPPVLDANGNPVDETVVEKINEPQPVPFTYRNLRFTILFDRANVSLEYLLKLNAKSAQLQRERENGAEMIREGLEISEILEPLEDLSDAESREKLGNETWNRVLDFSRNSQLAEVENQPHLFPIKLRMLQPGILGWNLKGRTFSASDLEADGELARAVVPALWEAYRPFTKDSSDSGSAPTEANSSESVSTSKPTEKKANSPKTA